MLTVESFSDDFLQLHKPYKQADSLTDCNYLLAYSGGCDSHVLLHLLSELKRSGNIKNISAIHVNHQLNKDSNLWAEHCIKQCELLSIPCEVVSVDVDKDSKLGLEAAARKARYDAISNFVSKDTFLLTAQHADDQAETFLLQSLRGSGVKGLSAMPEVKSFSKGQLTRPLLKTSQVEIYDYAQQHKLEWIEDPSNVNIHYDRNFLRRRVMPVLKQRWPMLHKTIQRVTNHQSEAAELMAELAQIDLQSLQVKSNTISIDALEKLSVKRQKNVLRYWIHNHMKVSMPDSVHLMRVLNELIPAEGDGQPEVCWDDVIVRRFNKKLYLDKQVTGSSEGLNDQQLIWLPEKIYPFIFDNTQVSLETRTVLGKGLSRNKLQDKQVTIRFRQGGEVCTPQGRDNHQHKLKKLFQEWQVPPWQRNRVPLIFVGDTLAQVVGYCVCEPYVAKLDEMAYQIVLN